MTIRTVQSTEAGLHSSPEHLGLCDIALSALEIHAQHAFQNMKDPIFHSLQGGQPRLEVSWCCRSRYVHARQAFQIVVNQQRYEGAMNLQSLCSWLPRSRK